MDDAIVPVPVHLGLEASQVLFVHVRVPTAAAATTTTTIAATTVMIATT
jgi:hypothetical protein